MITRTGDKLYWGYVDYNEKIHIKLYRKHGGDKAIQLAQDSGTTIGIFEPFYAKDIEEATHKILENWRETRVFMKKDIK